MWFNTLFSGLTLWRDISMEKSGAQNALSPVESFSFKDCRFNITELFT
uniref:Uncharacterized protein n=1 Tax=Anguilla anguilla TaxID=7936 RepID=A0A0E9TCN6_ANGAN